MWGVLGWSPWCGRACAGRCVRRRRIADVGGEGCCTRWRVSTPLWTATNGQRGRRLGVVRVNGIDLLDAYDVDFAEQLVLEVATGEAEGKRIASGLHRLAVS